MKFTYTFPADGICSKITLEYFGEKVPSYDDSQAAGGDAAKMGDVNDLDKFIGHLKAAAKQYDDTIPFQWKSNSAALIPKLAIVEAYTCSWQPEAEKHLEALGFAKLGPFKKLKHSVTDLTVWVIGADDLCKRIGYVCDKDPRTVEERGY